MTREEARVLLKNLNNQLTSAFYDGDFWVEEGTFEAFEVADAALRQDWVRTADRLPEGDEHDGILGLYNGPGYLLYDSVRIGWLRLHPEMYVYWTHLPKKPEVEG